MNKINNMDDLVDDNIGTSLRQLGLLFPRTAADFKKIENEIKHNKAIQPERLKDPYSFLGKRNFKSRNNSIQAEGVVEYTQNLAQAAREGKLIPEEIKQKMAADKLLSSKKKNDQ